MIPERRVDLFLSKIERTDGCWFWHGHIEDNGYGRFYLGKDHKPVNGGAHRLSYEHFVGPIPAGFTIDHLCKVRNCVNPAHLEAVTPGENTLRGNGPSAVHARMTHCIRGHPLSGDNLFVTTAQKRGCRACRKVRIREWQRKKRREMREARDAAA